MSRRPAYDEVASVVVLEQPDRNNTQGNGAVQYHFQQNIPISQPYKSNLLSNENVIAFAAGVVIDDGSHLNQAAQQPVVNTVANPSTTTTSMHTNRFQNVSRR